MLARDKPLGLAIRRGPSKSVCTLLWDRQRDEFRLGQWLKGHIYERRSDLSPDGRYFIYFAMNGRWQSESRGAWTAIARAPFLKAIAIFPKGDCWHGGGLFIDKNRYWLNDGYGHTVLRNTSEVERDLQSQPQEYFGGECPGLYYPRLLRDGWSLIEQIVAGRSQRLDIFEKPISRDWTLRKIAHAEIGAPPGKGCYWDEHELINARWKIYLKYPDWEWADIDKRRLVWSAKGRLFAGRLTKDGLTGEEELYDFNPMAFERIEAPY